MKHGKRTALRCEVLEDRRCLAPIGFDTGTLVGRSEMPGADAAVAADIDGDGDLDIVSAGGESILTRNPVEYLIAWSENLDGRGTYGRPQTIATSDRPITSLAAFDIDGDVDVDLVATMDESFRSRNELPEIVAYENRGGVFSEGSMIVPKARLAGAFDVDSDGDTDLIGIESRTLYWYSNERTGEFRRQTHVSVRESSPQRVVPGDIDADGDDDVMILGQGSVYWSENTRGVFGRAKPVLDAFRGYPEAALADFDADGDLDIAAVYNPSRQLVWFEYDRGAFGRAQHIAALSGRQSYAPVTAFDLEGDGDQDILIAANGSKVLWFDNSDGSGEFVERDALIGRNSDISSLTPVDLNGDDATDLLLTARLSDVVAWYENDSTGNLREHRVVRSQSRPETLHLADVDHDDDLDLLAACYGDFLLWNNTDGKFEDPVHLSATVMGYDIVSADMDGDAKLDLVTADFNGNINWQRNLDGEGNFGAPRLVTTGLDGLESIEVGDVDGDGDVDVLSGSRFDGIVAWYENTDGSGNFEMRPIVVSAGHLRDVSLGDLDMDGDLDVLSASWDFPRVAWYPNQDGRGDFGDPRVLSSVRQAEQIRRRDMDNDHDIDVVFAASGSGGVYLLENTDGAASFATERTIASLRYFEDLDIADLDNDGDLDIAVAHLNSVSWIENLSENQFSLSPTISDIAYSASAVAAGDIDRDGRRDLIYASADTDEIQYRRSLGVPGDANGDGVFNSIDLTQVFRSSEYEDAITGNSTRAEGDFDGDGDFTSTDLVHAFTFGGYSG